MQSGSITLYAAGNEKQSIIAGDPIGRIERPFPIPLPRLQGELVAISRALAWCHHHNTCATVVTSSRLALDMLLDNSARDLRSRRLCRGIYRQLIDIEGLIVIRPREENLAHGAVRVPAHYYRTDPVSGLVQLVADACPCKEVTISVGRQHPRLRNVGRNAPRR